MKSLFFLSIILLNVFHQKAQSISDFTPKLTDITPVSPTAKPFIRYGEIPVSHSTGIPEISIPIHVIEVGEFKFPISISYHAGGNKVYDVPGPVGLGWVLNAGGVIAQTVYGKEDSYYLRALNSFTSANEAQRELNSDAGDFFPTQYDFGDFYPVIKWAYFLESPPGDENISDRYAYNFNGNTGAFRYDFATRTIKNIPHSPLKINRKDLDYFRITDTEGNVYTFNKMGYYGPTGGPLSWEYQLTKINITQANDSIIFLYEPAGGYSVMDYIETGFYGKYAQQSGSQASVNDLNDREIKITHNVGYAYLIKRITYRDTQIEFSYTNDRLDLFLKQRLNQITIQSGNVSKKATFTGKYLGTNQNNYRLLLDQATINGDQYKFKYEENITLPPQYYANITERTFSIDFWGYYNGARSQYLIPFTWPGGHSAYIPNPRIGVQDYLNCREANPDYTQAGILKEIVYPTGGKAQFEYQQNEGSGIFELSFMKMPLNTKEYFGGLRIWKIHHYDNNSQISNTKTYEYQLGSIPVSINPYHFCQEQTTVNWFPVPDGGIAIPSVKTQAVVSRSGTSSNFVELGGNSVFYPHIIEYNGTPENNSGYTEYRYKRFDGFYGSNYCQWIEDGISAGFCSWLYDCDKGLIPVLLEDKKEFEQGKTKPNRETRNVYRIFPKPGFTTGINIRNTNFYSPSLKSLNGTVNPFLKPDIDFSEFFSEMRFYDINADQSIVLLDSTIVTDYTDSGNVPSISTFDYDSEHRLLSPTKITLKTSNGGLFNDVTTHPFNYPLEDTYREMTNNRNIISPVVTMVRYDKNNVPLMRVANKYKMDNKKFVIDQISTSTGNNTPETRIRYHKYDSYGNPTCVSYEGGPMIIYIWGYKGQYPVAKIETTSKESSYYTTVINAIGSSNVTTLSGTPTDVQVQNIFTNLRSNSNLAGALITSYTYKSLVGITSETDPSGRRIDHIYDDFGRLKYVKDEFGKIIKEHRYNYVQ